MKNNNEFWWQVGRLQVCFQKNGSKVQIAKISLDEEYDIKDIRSFPYEEEIEDARREAHRYFGLRVPRRKSKKYRR